MTNPFLAAVQAAQNTNPPAATSVPTTPPPTEAPPTPPAQTAPAAGAAAIGGVGPAASSDPFAKPAGVGSGAKIADDLNQALLLRPTEYIPTMQTSQGATDAVRADWIVLSGPAMGQVRSGSLIFQKLLKAELRAIMGTPKPMMVATLVRAAEGSNGNSPAYYFQEADDSQRALAAQAASANNWI